MGGKLEMAENDEMLAAELTSGLLAGLPFDPTLTPADRAKEAVAQWHAVMGELRALRDQERIEAAIEPGDHD
jgi:hypothetical protein